MNQELLNKLKQDPETLKQAAQEAGLIVDQETQELFKPLELDEMASVNDIAKEFNKRLQGIQKWVSSQVETGTNKVKEDLSKKDQDKIQKQIVEFAKTHPEMKQGSDVVSMMEQLYANGNTDLEDIYKKSCTASGIKPVEVKEGKNYNMSNGKQISEDGKEVDVKKEDRGISSLRSDKLSADTEDLEDGKLIKDNDVKGKTVREIADSHWNEALAESGLSDIPD